SLYGCSAATVVGRRFSDAISVRRAAYADLIPDRALGIDGLADGAAIHIGPTGRNIPVRVSLTTLRSSKPSHRYLAIISDDSCYAELADSLKEHLTFQKLLLDLTTRFSTIDEDEVENEIELWLRRLVETLNVDRAALSEFVPPGRIRVTHSCALPGVERYPKGMAEDH